MKKKINQERNNYEILIEFGVLGDQFNVQMRLDKMQNNIRRHLDTLKLYGGVNISLRTVGRVIWSSYVPVCIRELSHQKKERKHGKHYVCGRVSDRRTRSST